MQNNSDPTAYLRAMLDPDELVRVARIEKVKTAYMTSSRDDDLERLIKRITTNAVIRRDPTKPHSGDNRVEGKGLCIVAPSGAGKSTLLEEMFRSHAAFPNFRDGDKWSPLIGITAPSPSTLGQIGTRILEKLDYDLNRELKENRVWFRVREEFQINGILFLWIDDLNNILTMSNQEDVQKVRDTLKDLMNNPAWPIQIIISGVPDLLPFFRKDKQLRRRFRFLYLDKLASRDHAAFLGTAIEHYCELAEITLSTNPEDDLVGRLLHAGTYEMGLCLEIAVEAVIEALERNSKELKRIDFANAFADRGALPDEQNPFIAPAWHTLDITRLRGDEIDKADVTAAQAPKKRGRPRK